MTAPDEKHDMPGTAAQVFEPKPRQAATIHALTPLYLEDIRKHVHALNERDRYMRFGFQATDDQIDDYLNKIDFNRDDVFGVLDNDLNVVGVAHLAYGAENSSPRMAEFGVSVSAEARGQGLGGQLFAYAAQRARRRGIDQMFIHTLSKNVAMIKIVKKAGAEIFRDGGEIDAYLNLLTEPQVHMWMDMQAAAQDHAARMDYGIKVGLKFLKDMSAIGGKDKAIAMSKSNPNPDEGKPSDQ